MPKLIKDRPFAGEDVDVLWKHVNRLIDRVNQQATLIAELQARLPRRRPVDQAVGGGGTDGGVWL